MYIIVQSINLIIFICKQKKSVIYCSRVFKLVYSCCKLFGHLNPLFYDKSKLQSLSYECTPKNKKHACWNAIIYSLNKILSNVNDKYF